MKTLEPKKVNWRKNAKVTDADPDDTELRQTPADIVFQLGFDPKEFSDETE